MAVCRGGVSYWVGRSMRSHGNNQPITKQSQSVCPILDWQLKGAGRALCHASRTLAPPNSRRCQTVNQAPLSHPSHHARQPYWASGQRKRLGAQRSGLPRPPPFSHYSCSEPNRLERSASQRDTEYEEKLAMVHEKLRTELPSFFMKHHNYSIYSSDVEFINGLLNTKTRGRVLYQLILSLWRLLCLCYYVEARMEVLRLTKHPEEGSVRASWRVKGVPFHCLPLHFYRKDKSQLYRTYAAFSTFYVGTDGLIHCHKVEKADTAAVMQAPPLPSRATSLVAGTPVALRVPEHQPALPSFVRA